MKPSLALIVKKSEEAGYSSILDVPENELRDMCRVYCFDLRNVAKKLRLNNYGSQLLNGHLALDHVLSVFISDQFIQEATVNIDRWSVSQKAELVFSLGYLPASIVNAVKRVNSLRNKLAHELSFKVSTADIDRIISVWPRKGLEEPPSGRMRFAECLLSLVLSVEGYRAHNLFSNVMQYRALLNARKVLDEIRDT